MRCARLPHLASSFQKMRYDNLHCWWWRFLELEKKPFRYFPSNILPRKPPHPSGGATQFIPSVGPYHHLPTLTSTTAPPVAPTILIPVKPLFTILFWILSLVTTLVVEVFHRLVNDTYNIKLTFAPAMYHRTKTGL